MDKQLEIPRHCTGSWYVGVYDEPMLFLHNDGKIKCNIIRLSPSFSSGWFDTEQAAWNARSRYYKVGGIEDIVLIVSQDDTVKSIPLFDD